ncbi:hypothetical protein [Atlantibacter hermannii]|uniref:hypothetical protein n=1 Tax=Atlantibacter hermannii TaxID=565 RepID=UPI0028A9028A|nr:hypothetical protein [Atlantibacter hermannii]
MTLQSIGDVSSHVKNFGEQLKKDAEGLMQSLKKHWDSRDFLHHFINVSEKGSGLRIEMTEFDFFCETKTRFVFSERELMCEIAFFTIKDEKELRLFNCYLQPGGELTIDSPQSEHSFSIYYARNLEAALFDKVIQSASSLKLISL